mmetsp:Transcript_148115/g.474122  ORF Transcript_148115/g.474122 Transcript_148115/m.474122 type:complete len:259 (-) Transcript_148115:270-1046(-)
MSSVVTSECHASIEETTCQEVAETLDARTGAHQLNVWSAKATLPSDPEREKFNSHDGDEAALPTLLQSRGRGPAVDEDNDAKDPHQTADKPVEDADHGSDFEDAEEAEKEVEEEAAAELDEEVAAFLKIHHFSDVNARRGWIWNYDYPLHCAAKHADVEMVRLLLVSKAVRRQKNCDGLTARAVAKMQNVFGSHDAVIKASLPRTEEARPHTEAPLQPAVLQLAAAEALQLAETDRGTADACAQRDLGDRPVGEADGI